MRLGAAQERSFGRFEQDAVWRLSQSFWIDRGVSRRRPDIVLPLRGLPSTREAIAGQRTARIQTVSAAKAVAVHAVTNATTEDGMFGQLPSRP